MMQSKNDTSSPSDSTTPKLKARFLVELILLAIILVGVGFRFNWVDWNQGANLHPDEYGLTNTLTQLRLPESFDEYFNTRISPISPYQKYDELGQPTVNGPDNRMRWGQWPIIILRAAGELTDNTGYDEIRLMGRSISALADALSLLLIFLIGRRLHSRLTGLLAAALSALAVMQIQQSHFMTVDNFGVFFSALAMYACVRVAQQPGVIRNGSKYQLNQSAPGWYILFGIAMGMALSTKINLLPLAGLLLIAAFLSVADLKLRSEADIYPIVLFTTLLLVAAGVFTLLTFRLTQPMSFRAVSGDTTFFTLQPNQDWLDSMSVAQNESRGIGGGPPAEQWSNRPAILFPLMNMVIWGMGLPLGVAAWAGFLWALWKFVRRGEDWRANLLPLVWVGGYFFFMGTRWVKSIRYFLPIYPFLCLFAAWGLLQLWRWARQKNSRAWFASALIGFVILGTFAWANAFVSAVYRQDHTRIQATQWILHEIPAPFMVTIRTVEGFKNLPIGAPDGLILSNDLPFIQTMRLTDSGDLAQISIAHATVLSSPDMNTADLDIVIAADAEGKNVLAKTKIKIDNANPAIAGANQAYFDGIKLEANFPYFLIVSTSDNTPVQINRTVLANESWDEGLPFPFEGYDPFGQLYTGLSMEVRWYDDENKRQMFLDTLAKADYVILPSQRAIWSASRIPLTYPMTMEYYRALFDSRLGFELAAEFHSPWSLGPLQISDVGGTAAWGQPPNLPLFNYNPFAAEEAFSVYDHPPVWIFKKTASFNPQNAQQILSVIDLSKVEIQSPREAVLFPGSQD